MKPFAFIVLLVAGSLLLSACEPLERLQTSVRSNPGNDLVPVRTRKVTPIPVLESLDFNQAVALALRHSLARRVDVLREITAKSRAAEDASGLPELAAYPRYQRNHVLDKDNAPGLEATLEQQRILAEAWDVLDVALARHSLQRLGSQRAQNHYLRRRAVQNITQEVRQYFWAAWIWQQRGDELIEQQTRLQQIIAELVVADRQGGLGQRAQLQWATTSLHRLQNLEQQLRGGSRGLRRLIGPLLDVPLPLKNPDGFDPVTLVEEISRLNLDKIALLSRPELRNLNGGVSLDRAGTVARLVLAYPQIADWLSGGVEKEPDVSPYRLLKAATHLAGSLLEITPGDATSSSTGSLLISQAVVMQLRLAQQRYEIVRRYAKYAGVDQAENQAVKAPKMDIHATIHSQLRQFDNDLMRVVVRNAEARLGNSISDDVLLNADMQGGLKGTAEIVRMYMNKSVVGAYRSSVRFLIDAETPVLRALEGLAEEQSDAVLAEKASPAIPATGPTEVSQSTFDQATNAAEQQARDFLNERKEATKTLLEVDSHGRWFTLLIGRQGGENAWAKVASWLSQEGVSAYRNRLFVYADRKGEVAVTYGVFENVIDAIHATRASELQHLSEHTHMQVVQIANLVPDLGGETVADSSGAVKARKNTVASQSQRLEERGGESGAEPGDLFEWRLRETDQWMKTITEGSRGYTIQLAYRSGNRGRNHINRFLNREDIRPYLNDMYLYQTTVYGDDAMVLVYGYYTGFRLATAEMKRLSAGEFESLAPLQIRDIQWIRREYAK